MKNRKNALLQHCLLLSLLILISIPVRAQIDTASLTGQITDAQNAVIVGARVAITNTATNITVETTTNEEGYFTFAALRPSLYKIEVSQTGFGTQTRKDVELNIGQKARFDFQLFV